MSVKKLVETIKHNGILASAGELQKLFTKSVEAEEKNIELQKKLTDMAVQLANAESKCRELAAENGRCKFEISRCHQTVDEMFKHRDKWVDKEWLSAIWSTSKRLMNETPATDAFLAEVRASARNEGINYAASRLAAAYNHGFIGKSMSEVADVVHMILDAKTDLANATIPPADGLSGKYAEKSLAEFAAQLRKGDKS